MLGRLSTSTTRTTSTGGGVADPIMSAPATHHPRPERRSFKNRFGLKRLHPDHTNPALRTKINDPRVSGEEAREAQVALADRGEAVPKRTLSTRIKRLSNKWRHSGTATSKTTTTAY